MTDDDNSQDYEGFKRAAESDLTEESASSGKKDAPDLTEDDEEEEEEEESDMVDTGITKEEEIQMGLRNPDGSLVKSDLFKDDLGVPQSDNPPEEDDDDDEEEYKDVGPEASQKAMEPQSDNAVKDTKDWTTGDEPATAAQKSYISTMAVETKEEVPFELTKAEASEKIHELQQKTGRDDSRERP
jgi:hypothetical protein